MQPEDLKYSRSHEWVRADKGLATIGITDHAQSELGDIVFLELPEVGATVIKDMMFGSIESVKTVSDLTSPVSGDVVEVNGDLVDAPEQVNEDPYHTGWMIIVKIEDPSELDDLMSSEVYQSFIMEH